MRVLVDALPVRDGGGLTYLLEELRALEAVAPDVRFEVVVAPWSYQTIRAGIRSTVRCVRVRSVLDRYLYQQSVLLVRARAWDVLYCPLNFGPTVCGGDRAVLTLHNANYFGDGLRIAGTRGSRPAVKVKACHAAVRQCRTVVAISDSLRDEIIATLPASAPKVRVVKSGRASWEGVDPVSTPNVPNRFVLTVGSGAPHKRIDRVVDGWARAIRSKGDKVSLVVVGGVDDAARCRQREIAGPAQALLIHLGGVTERGRLRWLYERALCTISMSVLEAFPLTIGEAGALGCPLILSDIPSHREVSLGNAVFVPPGSTDELASVLPAAFGGQAGSRPWIWPVTWEEHAREMLGLFAEVAE